MSKSQGNINGEDMIMQVITKVEARGNARDSIFYTIIDALNKVEVDTSVSVESVVVDCGELGICNIDAIDGVWRSRWESKATG